MKIEVYADGSGNTFDSDGGWGCCLVIDGNLHSQDSGYLASATNNTAEITAGIEGLKAAQEYIATNSISNHEVVLISDSQLVLGYASGKYKCNAVHLAKLFINIKNLYNELSASVKWVKGHSGDKYNEICDQLAGDARKAKLIKELL